MKELDQVGRRLRAARLRAELTLEELAQSAKISVSTLSRIESGKRQLNLETLLPITQKLGLKLDDLVQPEIRDPRINRPTQTGNFMAFTPLTCEGSLLPVYRVVYAAHSRPVEQQMHSGHEWFLVVSGKVMLHLGDQKFLVSPGQSAEFDTGIPHKIEVISKGPAEVISINTKASIQAHFESPES